MFVNSHYNKVFSNIILRGTKVQYLKIFFKLFSLNKSNSEGIQS